MDDYASAIGAAVDASVLVCGDGSGAVVVVDTRTGEGTPTSGHDATVVAVDVSRCGERWASVAIDGSVRIGARDGTSSLVRSASGEGCAASWSPSGERLAIGVGRVVEVYGRSGERIGASETFPSTVADVCWSPRGEALAVACYGGVHLVDRDGQRVLRQLPWKGSLLSLAWSPEGDVVAASSQDGTVQFWRLATGQDSEMRGFPFKPKHLGWSHDGRWLATSGAASATVWSFADGGPEGTSPVVLDGHRGLLSSLAFEPSGPRLATASEDTSVLLWEPSRGDRPVAFAFLEEVPTALRWVEGGACARGGW
jgi:WD40 repeat protein